MSTPAEDINRQKYVNVEKSREIISSYFPALESSVVSGIAPGFTGLNNEELEIILHAGKGALRRGIRVLIAYLGDAPHVYKTLGKDEFENWLILAKRISKLSVSCCEGFFDSSLPIIEKRGLALLEEWTNTGIALSDQNKWIAIAYFKHTGKVTISAKPELFHELVKKGRELGELNVKVSEAYFEKLLSIHYLLTRDEFILLHSITKKMINIHWLTAIELINLVEKKLPPVPQSRIKELLVSMEKLLDFGELTAMALFRNAGSITQKTDEKDFQNLMEIATDLAGTDTKSSKLFLDMIPQYLDELDLEEVREWIDKGIYSFTDNKIALRAFVPASAELAKHMEKTDRNIRSVLIDNGIRLADIQPECVESYFENASDAYDMLSTEMFEEWVGTGEGIAIQDPDSASAYYENSLRVLNKILPENRAEIFRIANMLLSKESALTASFFANLGSFLKTNSVENAVFWANTGLKVYPKDRKLAFEFFENSPSLLEKMDIEELETWTLKGIETAKELKNAGKAYFALESRSSIEMAEKFTGAISLKNVANVLRYYALGLSGNNFVIRSMASLPLQFDAQQMNPIIAGNTIYLAPRMRIYENEEDNFRIYKLSVMHEVGHEKFSSSDIPLEQAHEIIEKIKRKYPLPERENSLPEKEQNTETINLIDILSLFPNPTIAATITGLLEDARVEYMIMNTYRGVRSELEEIRNKMLFMRPGPEKGINEFMEGLLRISTGHAPVVETDESIKIMLKKVNNLMDGIFQRDSDTFTSLELAFDIYIILDSYSGPLEQIEYNMLKNLTYRGMDIGATGPTDPMMTKPYENVIKNFIPETESDLTADEERPKEQATKRPTKALDKNWKMLGSYRYDEWDSNINDYRVEWSTVNEIEPVGGNTSYYNRALERYGNEISLLKSTFTLMKPEDFRKMKEQNDGTEIDIDAFTESLIAKKCGLNSDDGLYIRWDKHERDVATLFLIDVSASTRKILGSDGRSILDVEKDSLIIMSQALESIGDKYAIYAFSGKSREDVEYFVIKDFDEDQSDTVARRISILEPASNTRLGPAIRHSIKKLEQARARTKMLILLSDGEPYDRSRGEDSYQGDLAQEDTRIAIEEGRTKGMHFFCITVDMNPGDYLDNIFSDVGYTIIDDALALPEMLPLLYRRLTT